MVSESLRSQWVQDIRIQLCTLIESFHAAQYITFSYIFRILNMIYYIISFLFDMFSMVIVPENGPLKLNC